MAVVIKFWTVLRHEDTQTGLWCPDCLKPSGYEVPYDVLTDAGVSRASLTVRKCYDCGRPL